jgi:hypothetical protein
MKQCCSCHSLLDTIDFHFDQNRSDGLASKCKTCANEYRRQYRKNNPSTMRKINKKYYSLHKVGVLQKQHNYYLRNSSKIILRVSNYNKSNMDKTRRRIRQYYKNNSVKIISRAAQWRKNNPDKAKAISRRYKHKSNYDLNRLHTNIQAHLAHNLRIRLRKAIQNNQKSGSAVRDLGCTVPELIQHLESQFQPGMSWTNYGFNGWHIDHIIPLDSFDLTDRPQFLQACHYTNLQPLWKADNLSKGIKLAA